jgi:hypothetical protein
MVELSGMKVELHLHTKRYSGCAQATAEEMMPNLIAAGYGAVYITEHDAVWGEEEMAELQRKFPQIRIFPGMELNVGTGPVLQHLLVLGSDDSTYLLTRNPADVLAKARADGDLTILAHPYRWEGAAAMLNQGWVPDAMEFRSGNHDAAGGKMAAGVAGHIGIPVVNAGDVHGFHFINRFWIETDRPIVHARDIRQIVVERAFKNCSNE